MIIKKGKIDYKKNDGNLVYEATCTVIEKTEGGYIEILFCRDYYQLQDTSMGIIAEQTTQDEFIVYHGKTIKQIMALNGLSGDFTWTEPLTQIS